MKKFFIITVKVILIVSLCLGILVSCGDDDDDKSSVISGAVMDADPSYGFMVNSTGFRLLIDLGEREEFDVSLAPGEIIWIRLKENRTYVLHVVVLNETGRGLAEYVNSFYIDDVPLDNYLMDFVCSWYVEFTPVYPGDGFANRFGS